MTLIVAVLVPAEVSGQPEPNRALTWGANTSGQLGDGSLTDALSPVVTKGFDARMVSVVDVGHGFSCATADARAWCWGRNDLGQLGTGTTAASPVPIAVDTSGVLSGGSISTISAGGSHACAVANGKAYCWGDNTYGQLGRVGGASSTPVAVDTNGELAGRTVTAINAGVATTCAIADGLGFCWGYNTDGELGDGTTIDSSVPVAVSRSGVLGGHVLTAISAGSNHTCAVADGEGYCWGYNYFGRLGNGTSTTSRVPVRVVTPPGAEPGSVSAVEAGNDHTCGVIGGQAFCWGYGPLGVPAVDDSPVPLHVDVPGTVTHIAVAEQHSCAVADARPYCWGANGDGQLGVGSTVPDYAATPVAVVTTGFLAGRSVRSVSAGENTNAVLASPIPTPPTGLVATPGDAAVRLSWTAPLDDGGFPVDEYTVVAAPDESRCTSATLTCTVSGLRNGTPYTFTVTARNAAGVSAPSTPSPAVTPQATIPPLPVAPGKVTGMRAKVGKGTVKITWKAVPAATSYRLRISKPGGKKYTAWKTTSKRVFKAKVRKGKKYRFQVAAVNAAGRGPVTSIRFKGK